MEQSQESNSRQDMTTLSLKKDQKQWLDRMSEQRGLSCRFIASRALTYYNSGGVEDDIVMQGILDGEIGDPGIVKNSVQVQLRVRDESGWEIVKDIHDETGVDKSFVVRRAIKMYREKGASRDTVLKEMSQ